MHEIKNILGILATILVFLGYIPYLRDVIKGKTKPHIYSWFVWSVVTLIAFALQVSDGAGSGAFVTFAAGIICIMVIILGFFYKNKVKIVWIDTVFLILAFFALGLWLIAKQPLWSIILTSSIDVLGLAPTVRKSWNSPFSETIESYYLNSFRFGLAILALQKYSVITALYPISLLIVNTAFVFILIIRRRQIDILTPRNKPIEKKTIV